MSWPQGRRRRVVFLLWVWGLLATFGRLKYVGADVYIMTTGYVLDPLPNVPADFGPDIPDEGVEGFLRAAIPEDACSPFNFTDFETPWIALIARQQQLHETNCTFDVKVMNAQAAGASAAIVYDDVYESLIIMSKPKGHPDPSIPSVFVSQKAGIIMHKLMTLDTIRVRITPLSSVAWLSMLMSAFLGVLALGVVLATFYVMRSWSMWITGMHVRGMGGGVGGQGAQGQGQPGQGGRPAAGAQQDPGLPPDALRSLPVIVFDPQAYSARPSRAPSAAPSGAASLASLTDSLTQPGAHMARMAAAVGASVWATETGDEDEAEEMRPLLPGHGPAPGDLEEGCSGCGGYGEEEGDELASRSSSEGGAGAIPISGVRPPKPPGAHAGETKRLCAICLESYQEGDKIRLLPCAHRFHMGCVDQWLGSRRFCPVCKHDASQPLPQPVGRRAPGSGTGAAGGGEGSGVRGAGAAGGVNGWQLLFNGLVDLLRHPRVPATPARPGAAGGGGGGGSGTGAPTRAHTAHHQLSLPHRTRSRRHQQHLRTNRAAPDLQEPLVGPGNTPQQPQPEPTALQAAGTAVAAAPAGDVEAPGPSQALPIAAAAAASEAVSGPGGPDRSARAGPASPPIAIPAAAGQAAAAATATAAAPGAPGPAAGAQQAGAADAGPSGPAARVRAVLAGLLGGAVARQAGPSVPQYSSTL